jgi:hypothetical protein
MSVGALAALIVFVGISCQQQSNTQELYGRWVLDSTSGIGGKIISGGPREHTEFTLRQDGTFDYKWSDFDVCGDYGGTYSYWRQDRSTTPVNLLALFTRQK